MVSLMATLSMVGPWEKLLMPSFIYFFKLLYPFHLANSSSSRVAAAAGGTVLIETDVLREIGGFAALKDELIDDCALAAKVKAAGHGTWVGLSHSVVSHRRYPTLRSIWNMVARTAYTQLQYSPVLLLGCVLALLWTFVLPLAGLFAPDPTARAAAIVAGVTAAVTYLPTLIYYRRSPAWALLLPIIGALYLAMTVDSAYRFSRGIRSEWRGRVYATEPEGSMPRLTSYRGLNALVTGASSGIGRLLALRLAGGGARVALVARREEELRSLAAEIEADGGEAIVLWLRPRLR